MARNQSNIAIDNSTTSAKPDDWVCIDADDEADYIVERFEVRARGKKPLVLNYPEHGQLIYVTQKYLNISLQATKTIIIATILSTPDPLTVSEHQRLVDFLESKQ